MINLFHSFYSKLSLIFLLLILLLAAASLFITFNAAGHLFDEVEQILNREYAASLAVELQPFVRETIEEEKIKEAIHYIMVLNPMVEIYLIDDRGNVLAYFTGPDDMVLRHVIDMAPVRKFIFSGGNESVKGDDPRTENEVKPFSAAPMRIINRQGYVYVILRGQSFDQSLDMVRNSYYLKTGFITFLLAFLATIIAGLSLFALLTRRLRRLGAAVKAFKPGEYHEKVLIGGNDELAILGKTFNDMADSVVNGVQKLHEAEKQRSNLIANISHDLRSPLTSIRGHLETIIVKDDKLSREKRREYLETSLKNVSNFQKLVEELFELAKLESRDILLQSEPFQMAELAQDVILKLKPQSDNLLIKIHLHHEENLPPVKGDLPMIERVLTNIMENALSFTPRGGSIDLWIKEEEKNLIIEIKDTGAGIEKDDLPHIFERFYRADKSRDRRSPGTGLGLAIAKEIILLHKGLIEAFSPEEGGALFIISLPL